jgi:hypothetical protein
MFQNLTDPAKESKPGLDHNKSIKSQDYVCSAHKNYRIADNWRDL